MRTLRLHNLNKNLRLSTSCSGLTQLQSPSSQRPKTLYTMQKVILALMMGAAAAFQRAPIVRARVPRRISAQHHRLALREPGDAAQLASARRASSNSSRELLRALLPPRGWKKTHRWLAPPRRDADLPVRRGPRARGSPPRGPRIGSSRLPPQRRRARRSSSTTP